VNVSAQFTVGSQAVGGAAAAAPGATHAAGPIATPDPHTVSVGLGSYIQNFDYYQNLPIYPSIPANAPPSDANQNPVQPNITPYQPNNPSYPSFAQVPDTSRFWSSLVFQRTKAQGIDQSDSQGNRLFSMFADPFAMMVNSNTGNPADFAGLGLTRLTHLFINPATQYLDTPGPAHPHTQTTPLYPWN